MVEEQRPWSSSRNLGGQCRRPVFVVAAMPDQSIASRLANFAPDWGGRVAFSSIDGEMDFATLRAGMLGLAGWLAAHAGVGRGSRVALCLPKSLEAVQAIYGIHAAGAAYAPLQFGGPPARLAAILDSLEPHLLLTTPEMAARLAGEMGQARMPQIQLIETGLSGNGLKPLLAAARPLERPVPLSPDDLAVIVFTSGSTGEPKGVMIAQRSLTRRVSPPFAHDEILASDRMIVNAGLHYVAALDLFFPPATGCTTYLLSDHEAMFADRTVALMESHGTTIWKSTATALRLLTEDGLLENRRLSALRRVEFVGEPLAIAVLRRAMAALPNALFLHRFGSTEAYRVAQFRVPRPLPEAMTSLPLGEPNTTYQLVLRGEDGQPVGRGERGEICVIGEPVMLGYWKDPALTVSRRLDGRVNSFRTGDLGILGKDGLLRWAGRRDQIVKIRGHRIDTGEVEAVLRSHPGVSDCVALLATGANGEPAIQAFVLADARTAPDAELKLLCRRRLHAPARPARITYLDKLPLLASGKVDRQALHRLAAGGSGDLPAIDAIGPAVEARIPARRQIGDHLAGDGGEAEAKMAMAEGEIRIGRPGRARNDRQRIRK